MSNPIIKPLKELWLLRVALAIVFFWFGVLKFFPGLSPAEDLCARTIGMLTRGLVPHRVALPLLASWECLIAIGLLHRKWIGYALLLLFAQMVGAALPMLFFPKEVFARFPYGLTLEGQYIVKNLVLVAAALTIARAGPVRFARVLRARPETKVPAARGSEAVQ